MGKPPISPAAAAAHQLILRFALRAAESQMSPRQPVPQIAKAHAKAKFARALRATVLPFHSSLPMQLPPPNRSQG
jgi:hypothetical protein